MTDPARIVLDPAVLSGKPIIRGTQLSVDFILGLMADGWTEPDILRNYPGVSHEDLAACLAYARDVLRWRRSIPARHEMRFLANENLPGDAVAALERDRHDVVWVRTAAPGSTDESILAWAVREDRVLLTFDKDFGELAWRFRLPAKSGIILFRLPMPEAGKAGEILAARIGERSDWAGHFSVVEPGRIRMRRLAAP